MTTSPTDDLNANFVVRSEERLQIGTEWVALERVRVRRRIVSETKTVDVTVLREELVVEQTPIGEQTGPSKPMPYLAPLVLTLHEQVPVVTLAVRPYEQATISVVEVRGAEGILAELSHEEIELQTPGEGGGRLPI